MQKAFAGGQNSKGVVCRECGGHVVNSAGYSIFSTVVMLACLAGILLAYVNYLDTSLGLIFFVSGIALPRIAAMFFFKPARSLRNDV